MPKRLHRIDFNDVREIALELPGVEESASSRGPSLKVRGRLLTCPAIDKSAEPNSLMVRISVDERAHLLAEDPDTYYLTDHYAAYPAVLVRLSQISRDSLRDLLVSASRFVTAKARTLGHKAKRS